MCRFAFHIYKPHFACLRCRKMFRPTAQEDLAVAQPAGWGISSGINRVYPDREFKCPQCGQTMHNMGMTFKPPKHNDIKQWRKVELLVRNGLAWHDCGCGGSGPNCKTLRDAEEMLRTRRERQRALHQKQPGIAKLQVATNAQMAACSYGKRIEYSIRRRRGALQCAPTNVYFANSSICAMTESNTSNAW